MSLLAHRLLCEASAELARLRRIGGPHRRTARRIARARAVAAFAASLLAGSQLAAQASAATPRFLSPLPFGLGVVELRAVPAFGDLDGDGDLDALFGATFDVPHFFENTGTVAAPAFGEGIANSFGLADMDDQPGLALADLDGDGDLDLWVGSVAGDVVYFQNTGTALAPAFASPATGPFGLGAVASLARPSFADIDDDADLDAFVEDGAGDAVFFENTGDASAPAFAAPTTNPFGLADTYFGSAAAFSDLDGDGDLDAVFGDDRGDLVLFENTGSAGAPAFAAPTTNPLGLADVGSRAAPAFADLDADGDLDAFVGEHGGSVVFFENTGNASTPAFVEPAANRLAFPTEFGTNGLTGGTAFVDLDDDADLDLVIGSFSGNLAYFENTGTAQAPAFAEPVTNPFGLSDAGDSAQPAFGDLDDDGDLDALVRGFPGTGVFFENTGTASAPAFAPGIPDTFGFGGYNLSPSLVDVDADEDLDAFFTGIVFFENTGTSSVPAFGPYVGDPFGLSPPQLSFPAPAFGDLDGDGDLDVLAGDVNYASSGEIYFFENSGAADAPAFADPATNPFGLVDEIPGSPALADLDGDDDLDLFLRNGLRTFFYENRPESDPVCGNHLLEEGEQCDDGNLVDGDGCSAECSEEPLLCPAQPAQGCHGFAKAVLRVDERKPGREKLIAKLLGGPTLTQGNFGNPLMTGGTAMGVCVYDASGDPAAALEVERAGESCAGGDCWKPLVATPPAGVGFSYKDKAAAAHGVRKLSLRGGPAGRSRILCTAGNRTSQGQSGLPIGIAAALAQTTAVTVQLHTSDADCFSATLDQIQVQRSNLFKAK